VPIEAGSDTLLAMRDGSVITVSALTVEGQTFELPISLTGYSVATNRITDPTR